MRRAFTVSLSLLLTCLLVIAAVPTSMAQENEPLSWEIAYDHSPNYSFPPPDHLPEYLGIKRTDLTAEAKLDISLELIPDAEAKLTATLTVGDQEVKFSGQGSFGRYEQTPLQHGTFDVETEVGVAGKLYLQTYPNNNERLARLIFGEGTTMPATINFGEDYGNMYAIISQRNAYVKTLAKLPSSYELDGQPLTFEPGPYIADNQVLVPLRPLLQALGATVGWDKSSKSITASKGDISLHISVPNQTLQINSSKQQPLTVQQPDGASTFVLLEPVAEALGATVISRNDGSVCLFSRERTLQEQGTFQVIFAGGQNIILQNDTNRPYDLSDWALTYLDRLAETPSLHDFRFPETFVLLPGEQVQVLVEPPAEPDGKRIFAWEYDADRGPGTQQIRIFDLTPGRENISISSRESDFYLGNWRLVNSAGKPAYNLPSVWVPRGMSAGVYGSPGASTHPLELRWPNLPAIEAAYAEQQEKLAISDREFIEGFGPVYLPVAKKLGLNPDDYFIYPSVSMYTQFDTGDMEPFDGNSAASSSLQFAEWRLTRSKVESGDTIAAYLINKDGQEAYIAMIKKDGSYVAYHLELVIDAGYYTWVYEQVLPE